MPPQTLVYGERLPLTRRKRVRRWIVWGAVAFGLATICVYTPRLWRRGALLIAQHECLTFTGSNAAIVYAGAEDPFAVNAPPPITSAAPACWTSLSGILPAPAGIPRSANPANDGPVHRLLSPAPAYLHERSASNGERLVVAQLGEQALAGKIHRVICCRVFAPMGLRRDPVLLWEESTIVASSFDTGSMLRVSFGRTDGGDPSGFTIPIELGGAHKLLHGRLNPDDTITTEIKEAGIP